MQRDIAAVSHSHSFSVVFPSGWFSKAHPFGTLFETYNGTAKCFLVYIELSDIKVPGRLSPPPPDVPERRQDHDVNWEKVRLSRKGTEGGTYGSKI